MVGQPRALTQKDLLIGLLCFLLILAIGQNYLLPSQFYGVDVPRNSAKSHYAHPAQVKRDFDYDIVISYYQEPLDSLRETVEEAFERLPKGSKRVIIYYKGDDGKIPELLKIADEVVPLKNIGREGATYLSHIVRHYPTGHVDFARHTLFLQPHLAWDWVMKPRLSKVHKSTGFMSFGPYINMTEGVDVHGNTFSRINDIYAMFRQDLHPPHTLLATWAGQFIVSRKRLLDNTFKSYRNLLSVFEAPEDHWIWKEGWWNSQPSDPTLGHALERSWPIIFDCSDARMAKTCGEAAGPACECRD